MKMFHSSGTARGKVERMWRWKITIPATAIVPTTPPWETSRISGRVNSITVPRWAESAPDRRGPQVLGVVAVEPPLRRPPAVPGRVADHHRDDEGEVAVELRGGRPPPDADEDELRGDDHVGQREEEDDRQVAVDLRAGGEEGDLVAQAEQRQQREQHADRDRIEAAGGRGDRVDPVGEQQVERGGDQPRVERRRRRACAACRASAAPARARAAAASCPAAASRGRRRSSARSAASAAASRRRGRAPPRASSRSPPSGRRSVRSTSRRGRRARPAPPSSPRSAAARRPRRRRA